MTPKIVQAAPPYQLRNVGGMIMRTMGEDALGSKRASTFDDTWIIYVLVPEMIDERCSNLVKGPFDWLDFECLFTS